MSSLRDLDLAGARWRKSSYSGPNGGSCVEVAPLWRKSTYSGSNGGNCVEVGDLTGRVAVRDSKNPAGPALLFSADGWQGFVGGTSEPSA